MTHDDAAAVLGVSVDEIVVLQESGHLPDPIPDDYLDAVVKFRLDMEMAHQRKMTARGEDWDVPVAPI